MKHKPDVDELGVLVTTYHKTNKHPVETGFGDSFFYLPYALQLLFSDASQPVNILPDNLHHCFFCRAITASVNKIVLVNKSVSHTIILSSNGASITSNSAPS